MKKDTVQTKTEDELASVIMGFLTGNKPLETKEEIFFWFQEAGFPINEEAHKAAEKIIAKKFSKLQASEIATFNRVDYFVESVPFTLKEGDKVMLIEDCIGLDVEAPVDSNVQILYFKKNKIYVVREVYKGLDHQVCIKIRTEFGGMYGSAVEKNDWKKLVKVTNENKPSSRKFYSYSCGDCLKVSDSQFERVRCDHCNSTNIEFRKIFFGKYILPKDNA